MIALVFNFEAGLGLYMEEDSHTNEATALIAKAKRKLPGGVFKANGLPHDHPWNDSATKAAQLGALGTFHPGILDSILAMPHVDRSAFPWPNIRAWMNLLPRHTQTLVLSSVTGFSVNSLQDHTTKNLPRVANIGRGVKWPFKWWKDSHFDSAFFRPTLTDPDIFWSSVAVGIDSTRTSRFFARNRFLARKDVYLGTGRPLKRGDTIMEPDEMNASFRSAVRAGWLVPV